MNSTQGSLSLCLNLQRFSLVMRNNVFSFVLFSTPTTSLLPILVLSHKGLEMSEGILISVESSTSFTSVSEQPSNPLLARPVCPAQILRSVYLQQYELPYHPLDALPQNPL